MPYRVRTTNRITSQRIFIHARGYRDALRLQKRFGGKILGGAK